MKSLKRFVKILSFVHYSGFFDGIFEIMRCFRRFLKLACYLQAQVECESLTSLVALKKVLGSDPPQKIGK